MPAAPQDHGFRWPRGRDRLLIVSVGTGHYPQTRPARAIIGDPAALQGVAALQSLMEVCERMSHHPAMADKLPDALARRTRGRRHEA